MKVERTSSSLRWFSRSISIICLRDALGGGTGCAFRKVSIHPESAVSRFHSRSVGSGGGPETVAQAARRAVARRRSRRIWARVILAGVGSRLTEAFAEKLFSAFGDVFAATSEFTAPGRTRSRLAAQIRS